MKARPLQEGLPKDIDEGIDECNPRTDPKVNKNGSKIKDVIESTKVDLSIEKSCIKINNINNKIQNLFKSSKVFLETW